MCDGCSYFKLYQSSCLTNSVEKKQFAQREFHGNELTCQAFCRCSRLDWPVKSPPKSTVSYQGCLLTASDDIILINQYDRCQCTHLFHSFYKNYIQLSYHAHLDFCTSHFREVSESDTETAAILCMDYNFFIISVCTWVEQWQVAYTQSHGLHSSDRCAITHHSTYCFIFYTACVWRTWRFVSNPSCPLGGSNEWRHHWQKKKQEQCD